jgi:phosphoribosyl-AMP cyclohydrolase
MKQELAAEELIALVNWNDAGLVPAIAQDVNGGAVLMMAWMNAESLRQTLALGEAVYYSRSRASLWHKGATSGHTQRVIELRVDCDGDTLLLLVEPAGAACHTGAYSCFFRGTLLGESHPAA